MVEVIKRSENRSKVYSPYYPENGYVNPNYPFGLSQSTSQKILYSENRREPVEISHSKPEKTLVKKYKKEAIFHNLKIIL